MSKDLGCPSWVYWLGISLMLFTVLCFGVLVLGNVLI